MTTKKPTTGKPKKKGQGTSKADTAVRIAKFIAAYIANGGNGTQAALAAGYSETRAASQASVLLKDSNVAQQLQQFRDDVVAKASMESGLTVERLLKEVSRLAYSDMGKTIGPDGKMLLPNELDDETRAAVKSFKIDEDGKIEYQFWDKPSSHERGMKHLGLFKDDNKQKTDPLAELAKAIQGKGIMPASDDAGR